MNPLRRGTDSAKAKVLSRYREANAEFFSKDDGFPKDAWDIYAGPDDGAVVIGSGGTEDAAWEDAAARLK